MEEGGVGPPYEAIAEDWLGLLLQGQSAQVFGYMHPALAKDWTALTLREAADKVRGNCRERFPF